MDGNVKTVEIGSVRVFDSCPDSKETAVKILEEAAEVVEAWKLYDKTDCGGDTYMKLLNECADVIQATCNLIASTTYSLDGAMTFGRYMSYCETRNRDRGRITDN